MPIKSNRWLMVDGIMYGTACVGIVAHGREVAMNERFSVAFRGFLLWLNGLRCHMIPLVEIPYRYQTNGIIPHRYR